MEAWRIASVVRLRGNWRIQKNDNDLGASGRTVNYEQVWLYLLRWPKDFQSHKAWLFFKSNYSSLLSKLEECCRWAAITLRSQVNASSSVYGVLCVEKWFVLYTPLRFVRGQRILSPFTSLQGEELYMYTKFFWMVDPSAFCATRSIFFCLHSSSFWSLSWFKVVCIKKSGNRKNSYLSPFSLKPLFSSVLFSDL